MLEKRYNDITGNVKWIYLPPSGGNYPLICPDISILSISHKARDVLRTFSNIYDGGFREINAVHYFEKTSVFDV